MKYGFIGAGNMVSAIVKGMTRSGNFSGADILLCSKSTTSAQNLAKQCACQALDTAMAVAQESDVLVFGVKPQVLPVILPELAPVIQQKKLLVLTLAAGKTLSWYVPYFGEDIPLIRVMPNINAKIGAACSGLCANEAATTAQTALAKEIFSTIGSVHEIPENQFSIFSVIGGASVAFAYLYMDALARAAVKAGMPKKQALELTAETVLGSAQMVLKSGEAPWVLIDQVCSPGGTTIEGIAALEREAFSATLTKAFDAVLEKDQRLGK